MKFIHNFILLLILGGNIATAQNFNLNIDSTSTMPHPEAENPFDTLLPKINHNWLSYQMKITMNNGDEKLGFQCFLVNRIDSIIYLNLNKSGIELARAVMTPDSVIYVNKLEHQYFLGKYDFFEKIFGFKLNFNMMQSLFNAVDFTGFTNNYTISEEDGKIYYIFPQRQQIDGELLLMQSITLGANGKIIENDLTDLKTMRDITISYMDYQMQNNFDFFSKIKIEIEGEEILLEAEIKNVKINQNGPTRIKIPENFTPMLFK